MPGGDRTGPQGMGPMTGRAAGYCAGNSVPGYMNPYGGRGMAFGRGRFYGRGGGFGRGRGIAWYGSPVTPFVAPSVPVTPQFWPGAVPFDENAELEALRSQARELETTISGIQKRIEELETQSAKKEAGSEK